MKLSQNFRLATKLSTFFLCAVTYFPLTFFLRIFYPKDIYSLRRILTGIIQVYSKVLLWSWNVQVSGLHPQGSENYLIVGNHLSYLDVVVLASRMPACFVTSTEIQKSFFLGDICSAAGCVFVNRKNKQNLDNEIRDMIETLNHGLNVLFFPEATSTDGSSVLSFKRPLFHSAITTGKSVLPVVMNYQRIEEEEVTLKNRDEICWYGDMTFLSHFFNLLRRKSLCVNVEFLEPISPDGKTVDLLSIETREKIVERFRPFSSEKILSSLNTQEIILV